MAVDDSSAMPARVRLLTFDWLPFTDDLSASEGVYDAMDRLSVDGAFFENHYLQKPGFHGLVQALLPLGAADTVRGRVLIFGTGATPATELHWFPESLSAEFCGPMPESIELSDDDFCWMHFEADESQGKSLGAEFEALQSVVDSLVQQPCVVLITSLFGRAQPTGRFESLLPESLIRAPLWVLGTGQDCSRVQGLTGSDDVGHTIRQLLERGSANKTVATVGQSQSQAEHQATDLIAFCAEPGQILTRDLLIEHAGTKAVRCDDFLLVRCPPLPESEQAECRTALYSKPEDVWNLNDVAGQYHAIVDGLNQRLK